MQTVSVSGLGTYPAVLAKELKIGDRVIFSIREMGIVTDLQCTEENVMICLLDKVTNVDFSVHKHKTSLVGVLPSP